MTLTILSPEQIAAKYRVTQAQMDKCTRILDTTHGKIFYQVESQTTPDTTYTVRVVRSRLSCTCPAGLDGQSCWHMRAALASAFEYRQSENLQARREAEQAAQAKAEEAARQSAPLNPQGFSLMKQEPVSVRGFEIRYMVDGDTWMGRKASGWAAKGQLPATWSEICARPDVVKACIFPSYMRTWQSQRRQHAAEYTRQAVLV